MEGYAGHFLPSGNPERDEPFKDCLTCGTNFRPRPYHVRKGMGNYCSWDCWRRSNHAQVDILEEGYAVVKLSQGKVTLIDIEDVHLVQGRTACVSSSGGYDYAMVGGEKKNVLLHREIMNPPEGGMVVDHINGDTLDNRRGNLRLVTNSENIANSKVSKNNTSGYKGVSRDSVNRNRWCAQITKDGRTYRLGRFPTPQLAALAYDRKAVELFGGAARTNFLSQRLDRLERGETPPANIDLIPALKREEV